jgi:hypothetical protein
MAKSGLPVLAADAQSVPEVTGLIEGILADVPEPHAHAVAEPTSASERVAREAARKAALLSGSLALPPGPLGMLTVLPDLYLIWKTQKQMVADIFALHGRSAELTRTHMLYCLFRHLASQVLRDVVVRAGQRAIVRQVSTGALKGMLASLGVNVTRRIAGTAATRWVPIAGAAVVGAYAYWDTLQVARTARRLLDATAAVPPAAPTSTRAR